MLIESKSEMQWGSKSVYVTKYSFCKMKMEDDGLTKEHAELEWTMQMEAAKGTTNIHKDGKRCSCSLRNSSSPLTASQKPTRFSWATGRRQIRPMPVSWNGRDGWVPDHEKFGSDFFCEQSGFDAEMLKDHAKNDHAASSRPAKEQLEKEKA